MPKRDANLLLDDISFALTKIRRYTLGMDRDSFFADEKTIDAVVRNLEIVGEAVRSLPAEFKVKHPSIPWTKMSGLRNRIVHDYFGLDIEIIWEIVVNSVPEFARQVSGLRE
jgi:uncharacterized protein with HEPN domain